MTCARRVVGSLSRKLIRLRFWLNPALGMVSWSMWNGMAGGLLEPAILWCISFWIRMTRLQLPQSAILPESSAGYPAKFAGSGVWRNIGTPSCSIPILHGTTATKTLEFTAICKSLRIPASCTRGSSPSKLDTHPVQRWQVHWPNLRPQPPGLDRRILIRQLQSFLRAGRFNHADTHQLIPFPQHWTGDHKFSRLHLSAQKGQMLRHQLRRAFGFIPFLTLLQQAEKVAFQIARNILQARWLCWHWCSKSVIRGGRLVRGGSRLIFIQFTSILLQSSECHDIAPVCRL